MIVSILFSIFPIEPPEGFNPPFPTGHLQVEEARSALQASKKLVVAVRVQGPGFRVFWALNEHNSQVI